MSTDPYRLPRSVVPRVYTLALTPDLATATFMGNVLIDVDVTETVAEVALNAIELDIAEVQIDGTPTAFRLEETTQRLIVDTTLDAGPAQIAIWFTGVLNDKLRGWYRSTFVDADGNERVIATTQMQATDCRRAFPCFDEPDFKAVFDVTLIVEPGLLAVSNGAEVSREQIDGLDVVRFAPTMPMSTYLVAFVVGPLEATAAIEIERLGGGTIPLRVIHVPGKGHLTSFGLDAGAHALRWFQEYYDIPYPTDKCDMLALPDFAAGAMENLGCITYRESLLLADTTTATQAELENLAVVVCHEMAHMWFGDLVTMRWWNGIWLNEAFATFMEVKCSDAFRPDWKRWEAFAIDRSAALEVDSLSSTRTVEYPVEAPEDCEGMFDVLTYEKGGSLLRMLEQFLGEDNFRRGVNRYLTTNAYGNTETGDLWDAIEAANGDQPVRRLMDSWIWQAGYPLIRATLDGSELVLTQQRFAFGDTEDDTTFVVPIHLSIDGQQHKVLLDSDRQRITLPSSTSRVVVNSGGHGVFRVAYDHALRARLLGDGRESLNAVERYNLVDDAWNEVVAGRLGADEFLEFIAGFDHEADAAVWDALANGLGGVRRLVSDEASEALASRVQALVAPSLARLGTTVGDHDSDLDKKLRGVLVRLDGTIGNHAATVALCRQWYTDHLAGADIDAELLAAATTVVAEHGTGDDYERILGEFRTARTPQAELRAMYALADFPEAEHIDRTIELAFSGEVKSQNAPYLLARVIANQAHGRRGWDAVRRNWDVANERFPNSSIARMVGPVRWLADDDALVADVQGFFAERPIPQAALSLDQILERQRINAALVARERPRLGATLG